MSTLTVSFLPPDIRPASGYIVKYRAIGTSDYTMVTPNPTGSPVQIPGLDLSKAYEGTIQGVCSVTHKSAEIPFNVGSLVVLDKFDYLVLRYINDAGGTDLDTGTGFVGTGTDQDIDYTSNNNWVGYSKTAPTPYLTWGGDNTSRGGVEAILLDFKKFIADHPGIGSTVRIRLHAWWFTSIGTDANAGKVTLELQTWRDGVAPAKSGFDFTKTDGTSVDLIDKNITVTTVKAQSSVAIQNLQQLAELVYDTTTRTAALILI